MMGVECPWIRNEGTSFLLSESATKCRCFKNIFIPLGTTSNGIIAYNVALKPSIAYFHVYLRSLTLSPQLPKHLTCFITFCAVAFFWHTFPFQSSASLACRSFAIRLLSCKAPTLHIYATNGTGCSFCFDMVMHRIVNKNIENKFFSSFSIVTRNRICNGGVKLTCSRFIPEQTTTTRWQIHGLRSLFNK